jgi:hypothetical protein
MEGLDDADKLRGVLHIMWGVTHMFLEQFCQILDEVVGWGTMMGLRTAPFLWIFGSPYSLGGLEPCGHSCWMTFSGNNDFLRRRTVFHSTASMGSLGNFL